MTSRILRKALAIAGAVLAFGLAAPAGAATTTLTVTVNDNGTCTGSWQTGGTVTNPTLTCVTGSSAPTCNATAPTTISAGSSVNLTLANCAPSGGSAVWKNASGATLCNSATCNVAPTTSQTYYGTYTVNNTSTTYPVTITVSGSSPPPTTGSCSGYPLSNFGDLNFDGVRYTTSGMTGNTVLSARIVVPNPLPANWYGKTVSIAMFSYGFGDHWRKSYLSKSPCDFTATGAAFSQGTSNSLYVTFGTTGFYSVQMNAGDVWYLNIKNEDLSGAPSCSTGQQCDFAIRAATPQ